MVNWSSYNQSLVRRGEVMLDLDVMDSWHSELKRMNNSKKGAQYDYPNSFVQQNRIQIGDRLMINS